MSAHSESHNTSAMCRTCGKPLQRLTQGCIKRTGMVQGWTTLFYLTIGQVSMCAATTVAVQDKLYELEHTLLIWSVWWRWHIFKVSNMYAREARAKVFDYCGGIVPRYMLDALPLHPARQHPCHMQYGQLRARTGAAMSQAAAW